MFVQNSLRFRVLPNDEVLDGLWIKALGGIAIGESPFEVVCRRLLGSDKLQPTTRLANEVVTSALGRRTVTMLQNKGRESVRHLCCVEHLHPLGN